MSKKKRFAIVGTGGRSGMFSDAILKHYQESCELVAMCDVNQTRMDYCSQKFGEDHSLAPLPTYKPDGFEQMIRENQVDTVIVCCIDRLHHEYIARAMRAGCDAISEKPMTMDMDKCRHIYQAIEETGKELRVTFNYRYSPRNSKLKELLMGGAIGTVHSVHFEWLLDTWHGADYFRRWHRDKRNSGGLMVHKATHHFDLMNWWLDSVPQMVFGLGQLAFYGRENGERNGNYFPYHRATGNPKAKGDPFACDLTDSPHWKAMYFEAEKDDDYYRDQNVFGDGVSIEDDMAVMVRYANRATMTYHLTAYAPWEGYRVAFNGSKGRLELDVEEKSYCSGAADDSNRLDVREGKEFEISEPTRLLLRPHWGKPQLIEIPEGEGGHGGGDQRLLDDIFLPPQDDPLKRAANHKSGAWSILCGIAANESFNTGRPVMIDDLIKGLNL